MSLTELWLVRHGESIANVQATRAEREGLDVIPIDIRDADVPLSGVGREQASALGDLLLRTGSGIDAFYVSPYLRAQETLGIALGGGSDRTARIDERLRDRELGILDLLTRRGVARRHPEEAARRRHLGKYYHRPPGGESWADVALRLRSFLADLPIQGHERVLIVAHDAVVMLIVSLLLPLDEPSLMEFAASHTVLNASVTQMVRTSEGWVVEQFSDVSHLTAEGAPVTVHPGSPDVEPE